MLTKPTFSNKRTKWEAVALNKIREDKTEKEARQLIMTSKWDTQPLRGYKLLSLMNEMKPREILTYSTGFSKSLRLIRQIVQSKANYLGI